MSHALLGSRTTLGAVWGVVDRWPAARLLYDGVSVRWMRIGCNLVIWGSARSGLDLRSEI
ncbi:hypothetical protein ACLOJK_035117 [Asimina triloba]